MVSPRVLVTADAVGGVWSHTVDLLAGLAGTEFVTVLAVIGPPPSQDQWRELQDRVPACDVVDVGGAPEWLAADERTARQTAAHVARLADALNAGLVHLSQPSIAGCATFRMPVVAVCHSCIKSWFDAVRRTPLPADMHWRHQLIRNGLHRARVCVAPSMSFAATMTSTHGLSEPPHVILNGRDAPPARLLPMRDGALFAGRLWDEAKNVRVLDAAAARVSFPVEVAGAVSGPNDAAVTLTHLKRLGTLGRDRMTALLAERPILVSTAVYEPFGLSVLEGAQAGCALVLADIPTFRELWGDAAVFVDPNDAAGFAEALSVLIADRPRRERLGAQALAASRRFSADRMAAQYAALYRKLMFLGGAPAATQQSRAA